MSAKSSPIDSAGAKIRRKRILAAIAYFLKNTRNCRKTKLGKLLFFLDFTHFKKYGTSVTGYDYIAMPKGPVPIQLYEAITNDSLHEDFRKALSIVEEIDDDGKSKGFMIQVRPKANIETKWLSPKELHVLEEVATIFRDATAAQMSEITHLKNTPWEKTLREKGPNQVIDYRLALDEDITLGTDELEERLRIQRELQANGRA